MDIIQSKQAADITNTSTSSLLDLPGEIRNYIYRLLLCPYLPITLYSVVSKNQCSDYALPSHSIDSSILLTCRQIHTEATPILYEENVFVAHPTLLTGLPFLLDPTRRLRTPGLGQRIRRWYIHVRLDCDARYTQDEVTEAFSGCDSLVVEARQAMFRGASSAHLMLFKGVRGVGHARVIGSVLDEFAEWLEGVMTCNIGTECPDYADGMEVRVVNGMPQLYDVWQHGNR